MLTIARLLNFWKIIVRIVRQSSENPIDIYNDIIRSDDSDYSDDNSPSFLYKIKRRKRNIYRVTIEKTVRIVRMVRRDFYGNL